MSDSSANLEQIIVKAAVREWLIAAGWTPPAEKHQQVSEPSSPAITLENAPLGTKAPSIGGGAWCKTARGWKWNGPGGYGSTFPRPGSEWDGRLLVPLADLPRGPATTGKRVKTKPQGPNQQMPTAKAMELIGDASWARSYSTHPLDALELIRAVEQHYGRTEGAPHA